VERKVSDLKPHPLNAKIYGDGCDTELMESIEKKGVLVPILIAGDGRIVSGHRRYNAAQMLGLETVPVSVFHSDDDLDIQEAIIHSNRQREKTTEQRTREYQALKKVERERSKRRQMEAGEMYGKGAKVKENFPEPLGKGQTRDLAAAEVGMSGKTAEKASHVVDTADALEAEGREEEAAEIRDTLNNKSVSAAHRKAEEATAKKESKPVFNKVNENIDWAKWSWNPVTGCKHDCSYCYAEEIARRFPDAFPKGFDPHFREERLAAPVNTPVPSNSDDPGAFRVFVCSMADLFGKWVPDEWIEKVFSAIRENPQWTFLCLTKNPKRYTMLDDIPENVWLGTTVDRQFRVEDAVSAYRALHGNGDEHVRFLSCEPLLEEITFGVGLSLFDWVIVGSQSKTSKMQEKQPEWRWVENLLTDARRNGCAVYFKPNLTCRPKEVPDA